jgi:hypothetical protein
MAYPSASRGLHWEDIDDILLLSANENFTVCSAVNWIGLIMSIPVEKILGNEESEEEIVSDAEEESKRDLQMKRLRIQDQSDWKWGNLTFYLFLIEHIWPVDPVLCFRRFHSFL